MNNEDERKMNSGGIVNQDRDKVPVTLLPGVTLGYKSDEPKNEATRYDTGKRYDLLDPIFLDAMAHIMHVGAIKYGDKNWLKGLAGAKGGINHAFAHLCEYLENTPCDYGPREMHLAQVAVNAMFEYHFAFEQRQLNEACEKRKKAQDTCNAKPHTPMVPLSPEDLLFADMRDDLHKTLRILRETKHDSIFKHTTNSHVDTLLKKYEGKV